MTEDKILEIKYYLLPFFVFIFILIVFQNFYLFLVVVFIFFSLYTYFSLRYKNINFISIIFFIASLTLFSYVFFIFRTYNHFYNYEKFFTKKDYKVIDILRNGRYLIEDNLGQNFILYNAKKQYDYQDIITVYGMLYPVHLPYKNFKEFLKKQFFSTNVNFSNIFKIFDFDYKKYLIMKGINGNIYAKKIYFKGKSPIPFYQKLKKFIKDKVDKIYVDNKYKALVLGILIGDKSYLSDSLYKEFIHSSLVHIIVVSGGNIMFLIIFLSFILFFIPFYLRLFVIGIIVVIYAMIAGFDSSVIRATIMGILSLIALFFGRLTDTKRLLAFAFMIMLMINPYFLLYDLGFILSFLAILGILFFNRFKITEKKYLKGLSYFYNNYVIPTLGAAFFTAPAILLFIKKINLFGFVSNLFVVPILPVLIIVNILLLVFYGTFIGDILYFISVHIMDYIFYVAWFFGDKFTYFIHF